MVKVKRKKFSIKKTLRIVIPFILLLVIIVNLHNIITLFQSKITGYDFNTVATFHELDIYDDIRKSQYSDTLAKIINTDDFNKKYLSDYLNIEYRESSQFFENVNVLLDLGYNASDINIIYDKLSFDSIALLLENYYFLDISNVLNLDYFHEDKLLRYINYSKEKKLNYEDVVTYVNIGLDYSYYSNVIKIDNQDDLLVLVNKYHSLASDYVPKDLEQINSIYNRGSNNKLKHVARVAFEKMCEAAFKDGIKIYSGSAYRSYNYQLNLYNNYVNMDGKTKADTYSARAGYSEHQTGLALDILNAQLDYISASDKEYTWLVNNSYKYGFILRYPLGKENVTGYMYEEWHFRYVGEDIALKLHDSNLTYDEYMARN